MNQTQAGPVHDLGCQLFVRLGRGFVGGWAFARHERDPGGGGRKRKARRASGFQETKRVVLRLVACWEGPGGLWAQRGLRSRSCRLLHCSRCRGSRGRLSGRLLRGFFGSRLLGCRGLLGGSSLLHCSLFGGCSFLRSCCLFGWSGLLGGCSLLGWSGLLHCSLFGGCSLLHCGLLGRRSSLLGSSSLLSWCSLLHSGLLGGRSLLHSSFLSWCSLFCCSFFRSCHTDLLDQVAKSTVLQHAAQ